jgi:DNA repair protein SbcD/Mre11
MRILHTADLHLGRQFSGISLDDDHAAILDQIAQAMIETKADVLAIAGDVFDRAVPPASAVKLFNGFLSRVAAETGAAIVLIAGNHDSGDRIASMSLLADRKRALIRGEVRAVEESLLLRDRHGVVAVSALPFAYEYAARECFLDTAIQSPQDVMAAQVAAARTKVPSDARWVVVAHAFVAGSQTSDGERSLTRVGGIETVSPNVFDGANYVALGHLHRAQTAGAAHIRYSGSPMAFGFDEAGAEKSMTLIEIDGAGAATVELIPFRPLHGVQVVEGVFADILKQPPSGDFVRLVLADREPIIDTMKRIRAIYPNACELAYQRDLRAPEIKSLEGSVANRAEPLDVVDEFLTFIRGAGEEMSEAERAVVSSALDGIRQKEIAA